MDGRKNGERERERERERKRERERGVLKTVERTDGLNGRTNSRTDG